MLIVFYYGLLLFAVFAYFRRQRVKGIVCAVMIFAIVVFLGATKWQRTYRSDLVLTALDVGHGQAILAQLPGNTNILFDAGALHKRDVGRRIIAPFLKYSGINKIDYILISHNDKDHINGIPEVAESCKLGGVYANKAFFDKSDTWGTAGFLKRSLAKNNIKIYPVGGRLRTNSPATVKMLWPNEAFCNDPGLDDNDMSQVSLIEFSGKKILLCSDIGKFSQRKLLELNPALKADIVVAPHHGSPATLDKQFLKSLNPDILIHSCSRSQYKRQKASKLKLRSRLLYTSKDGAITVNIDKAGGIEVSTFAKK